MKTNRLFVLLSCLACLFFLASMAVAQWGGGPGTEELRLGVQASNQGKLDEAIEHFEKAAQMDGSDHNAQLFLGKAYAQKYQPGLQTPDNTAMAERAIEHYQKVIDLGAPRVASLAATKGIGALCVHLKRFDEAKDLYTKSADWSPIDLESHYQIGVIDWTQASEFRKAERAKLKLKPNDSLAAKNEEVCLVVRAKNLPNIDEGISHLNQGLGVRPTVAEMMTYLNLLYLERADIECHDPTERAADLKAAEEWNAKALAAKQANAAPQKQPASTKQ
jgi:tetratricopeptide (TPR) repeat protein